MRKQNDKMLTSVKEGLPARESFRSVSRKIREERAERSALQRDCPIDQVHELLVFETVDDTKKSISRADWGQ